MVRQSRAKLMGEMPQETRSTDTATSRVRLPRDFVLLPPVSMDDLKKDTEHDPEGAEDFVALISNFVSRTPAPSRCK